MSHFNRVNDKKKDLLAYKEKILKDIQYYEKRIDDFRANQKKNCYYDDADSSDSDDYFPNAIDMGPDETELKLQQAMMKTCLNATQELTSLTVLQSEVNVLVQDPQFNGEPPVTEAGTWKEVTAECRIDLVPFTITFYMHKPDRKFAPTSYRELKIALIKSAHEVELDSSVIHTLRTPSDAIEVVRSYAVAHRSRRTTLARLANKYASSLFMEPHPEGGFVLKCGNLLEILWRLENKWSQVAPFHHRMKFDLEYMDESYIRIITQAHKQLLDPSLQTDERTLLLSKIIATCLEARGPVDSESDLESRQTGVQPEIELTEAKEKDRDVMAPPKTLPKKTKKIAAKYKDVPKDKDVNNEKAKDNNLVQDKISAQKRSIDDEYKDQNAKKLKVNGEGEAKKGLKAKENVKNDDNNKKIKNSNVNNDEIKKKLSEDQDIAKKTKNTEKSKKTDKNNKQNQNTKIDENDKNATNTNAAKKRKNDNVLEDEPKTNNIKVPKKTKSNKEIKGTNIDNAELNPKKIKSSTNDNQNDKQTKSTDVVSKNNKNVQNTKAGNKGKNGYQVEEPKPKKSNSKAEKGISNDETKKKNNKNGASDKQPKNNEPVEVINGNKIEESDKIKGTIKEKNKNIKENDNVKKIDRKTKMSIANDNKFNQITKKVSPLNKDAVNNQIKNVANAKNSIENKNNDNVDNNKGDNEKIKNTEKKNIANVKSAKIVKNKKTGNTNGNAVTEKNATNFKNKEKIANINKIPEKLIKDKPIAKNYKRLSNEPKAITSNKKLTKIGLKSVRDIIHKSPKNKNHLKPQNPLKATNYISNGNAKMFFGNTEKENGAKISKIPQISNSLNSRVSPRLLPSKFKSVAIDTNTKTTTNIPRLMKKQFPKATQ